MHCDKTDPAQVFSCVRSLDLVDLYQIRLHIVGAPSTGEGYVAKIILLGCGNLILPPRGSHVLGFFVLFYFLFFFFSLSLFLFCGDVDVGHGGGGGSSDGVFVVEDFALY